MCSREKVCLCHARTERHHVNTMRTVLVPKGFREREHESFGCSVNGHVRNALKGCRRSYVDDCATLSLAHLRQVVMRERDQRLDVQVNHLHVALHLERREISH